MEFTREERAAISRDFRQEIQKYGVKAAVMNVLQSKSEKVEVRKQVIAQQCRKNSFRTAFEGACQEIHATCPQMRTSLRALKKELLT